jgi:hypothetical protein
VHIGICASAPHVTGQRLDLRATCATIEDHVGIPAFPLMYVEMCISTTASAHCWTPPIDPDVQSAKQSYASCCAQRHCGISTHLVLDEGALVARIQDPADAAVIHLGAEPPLAREGHPGRPGPSHVHHPRAVASARDRDGLMLPGGRGARHGSQQCRLVVGSTGAAGSTGTQAM